MAAYRYFCWMTGEPFERAQKYHDSTRRRLMAFAIALHIPVALWGVTSYLIATRILEVAPAGAWAIAVGCSILIYLVERLVLVSPKSALVSVTRLVIGAMVAVLGAVTFDLILFEREVHQQLNREAQERVVADYAARLQAKTIDVQQRKKDWLEGQRAAECEANGTCGSRMRNVGPVYRELARQVERLRRDYEASLVALSDLDTARERSLQALTHSNAATNQAGLLARIEALQRYVEGNLTARLTWMLLFALVLCFELTVVFVKFVFPETVDDVIERVRESVRTHQATTYEEALKSPLAATRALMQTPV